ncbi:hypothetical protein T11_18045 [Trichinella zimbabwensis]|uniref:Uncharacterized protein n=1 Tax=Trichinella zimbabwensis TaxID=268475 RepID=A0A0V1HDP1_9BILA|nr:hypothetical protein T11_18045 [Trichinella zimbabwensis]
MKRRRTSRANSDRVGIQIFKCNAAVDLITAKLPEVIEGSARLMIDPLLLKRPNRRTDYGLADEVLPVLHSVP